MPQVLLYPCVHDSEPDWDEWRGPQCDGAPGVKVVCRRIGEYHHNRDCGAVLMRKPQLGSAMIEAARRAFDSNFGPLLADA